METKAIFKKKGKGTLEMMFFQNVTIAFANTKVWKLFGETYVVQFSELSKNTFENRNGKCSKLLIVIKYTFQLHSSYFILQGTPLIR